MEGQRYSPVVREGVSIGHSALQDSRFITVEDAGDTDPQHNNRSCKGSSAGQLPKGRGRPKPTAPPKLKPYLYEYKNSSNNSADADDDSDNDDDRANASQLLMCCMAGVMLVAVFVIVLYHTGKKHAESTLNALQGAEDTLSLLNELHMGRAADLVMHQRQKDEDLGRLWQERLSSWQHKLKQRDKKADVDVQDLFQDIEGKRLLEMGQQADKRPLCEEVPPGLQGNIPNINLTQELYMEDIAGNHSEIMAGGEWQPTSCKARFRVAFIIPYRDRWSHLKVLLYYLIPLLKRQQLHFRFIVVEQHGNGTFNKGSIMNAAFREAVRLFDFQCVTFHDVDMVPENDLNLYTCTRHPKHMSVAVNKFEYILPYQDLIGGVLSFNKQVFIKVNGYSNMYLGWGGEDDDMTNRVKFWGYRVYRPPSNIARYQMIKHSARKTSPAATRSRLLSSSGERSKQEGLNNVKYKLLFMHNEALFTHMMVDLGILV